MTFRSKKSCHPSVRLFKPRLKASKYASHAGRFRSLWSLVQVRDSVAMSARFVGAKLVQALKRCSRILVLNVPHQPLERDDVPCILGHSLGLFRPQVNLVEFRYRCSLLEVE